MKPDKSEIKIDELISRAIGRERPTFDFDKWQADHQKEIQTYDAQAKKLSDSVSSLRIWKTIIKSKITQFAAAAVIIIVVLTGIRTFTSASAWAKIVQAFNEVENVHIVGQATEPNGKKTRREEYWAKRPNSIRMENSDILNIDNRKERLTIIKGQHTAQFVDSTLDYYPRVDAVFAFAALMRERDFGLDWARPLLGGLGVEVFLDRLEIGNDVGSDAKREGLAGLHPGELGGPLAIDPDDAGPDVGPVVLLPTPLGQ